MKRKLVLFSGLMLLFGFSSINAAPLTTDSHIIRSPVHVSKTATSMELSANKGRVFLDVKPAPVKMHFYAGKQRLGSLYGKRRTSFDITNYANRADKGQLRIVAYDDKGKQTARILDVSRYLNSTIADRPTPTSPSKQPQRGSKRYEMIEPAFKEGTSHSADFDDSAKSVRQPDKLMSSKIVLFLDKIKQANSLEDLKRSYNGTEFSKSETHQLMSAIQERQYRVKLENIARRELSRPSALPGKQTVTTKKSDYKESGTVTKSHAQQLQKTRNDIVIQKHRLLKSRGDALTAYLRPDTARTPSPQTGKINAPGASSGRTIHSVSPSRAQIGRNVTISGAGFGNVQGRVALLFDGRSNSRHDLVDCERIVSWADNKIVVTIPAAAASVVSDSNTMASIWVKVAGGETGPLHDITLTPDFSLLPPRIDHISHPDIIPNQPLLIQGENFLSQRQGEVFLRFAGKEFPAQISSWDNKLIEVQVPPIIGLLRTPGSVLVRNYAGLEATIVVTFSPEIWFEELWGPGNHGSYSDTRITVQCTPRFGDLDYSSGDDLVWLLCVFGQKRKNQVRISLKNDWIVRSGYTSLLHGNGWQNRYDCGAYYERGPVTGRGSIDALRVTWTNAYSDCTFRDIYIVEGPAGVSSTEDNYNPALACLDTSNRPELNHLKADPISCNIERGW